MEQPLKSKALEVNLEQTRSVTINLPPEHQWLIGLSETHYGIHNRANEFFTELHHPFSNRGLVINQLPNLIIGDFWFYRQSDDPTKAFIVLMQMMEGLFRESLSPVQHEQAAYTFLNFMKNIGADADTTVEVMERGIGILEELVEKRPHSLIRYLGHAFQCLEHPARDPGFASRTLQLVSRIAVANLDFWESTTGIKEWYRSMKKIMGRQYDKVIAEADHAFFDSGRRLIEQAGSWEELMKNTVTYQEVAAKYRRLTEVFEQPIQRFHYLFFLIHLQGMEDQRDQLLWDLNRMFHHLCNDRPEQEIIASVDDLFVLFGELKKTHNATVLDSVLSLGKEIISTAKPVVISCFVDKVIDLGFSSPGRSYTADNWHRRVNRDHVKNIRVWLELIECNPRALKKLLSALIIHLHTGGIFIFDNDLFQRDVTRLLNADIQPLEKQIKQLCRIFPVYFNEIGAEGELRDITTTLDEITQRNDKLIHFLRKQIHTEGNNAHIGLTLAVLRFWKTLRTEHLDQKVPPEIITLIDLEGELVTGVHQVVNEVCEIAGLPVDDLPGLDAATLETLEQKLRSGSEKDRQRVFLLIRLYHLLSEKYSFASGNICNYLDRFTFFTPAETGRLKTLIETDSHEEALKLIFQFIARLRPVALNPEPSQGWENIYHKRHIAYGIPSMYGEYHEPKFEALGVIFRLEQVATVLMENFIWIHSSDVVTAKTLKKIGAIMDLMREGMSLDGINSQGFDATMQIFRHGLITSGLSIRQYIDIFQFVEDSIKEIIRLHFFQPYETLLKKILPQRLHDEAAHPDHKAILHAVNSRSEAFYRTLLSSSFLIRQMDLFTGRVLTSLRRMNDKLSTEDVELILSYDADDVFSPFSEPRKGVDTQLFLGGKGYYLKKLFLSGFPVPPGFIMTTEVFRCKSVIQKQTDLISGIEAGIREHVSRLEKMTGRQFGNPLNPLLLSVRSGSAISMPGAMNTLLNVGMNDAITETLSKQPNFAWTSWDCYRRLLQTWGMSFGMDRNVFDKIILDYKRREGVSRKIEFPAAMMRSIAMDYRKVIADQGIPFEENPWTQLRKAVLSVFSSWDLARAAAYRNHLQIADEWGTAVIIQQMVLGNIHLESGSGVLFTDGQADPNEEIKITGDFSFLSQGEDIVAGLVNPLPISKEQRLAKQDGGLLSLEETFPATYRRLKVLATRLIREEHFGNLEIEFTFETQQEKDLYILQIRDIAASKQQKQSVFVTPRKAMIRVGRGTGIGNDVMNGLMAFDLEDIQRIRESYPGSNAILVRPDTVPDDIEMIFECDGLLTGKGGATSHAAVTAARLGKICIVNCTDLVVDEPRKQCRIGESAFGLFDKISLDSAEGVIYKGHYPIQVKES